VAGEVGEVERRQLQVAANESVFRQINESLEGLNQMLGELVPVGDFVCECGDTGCTQRIGLTIAEYEHLRRHPTWFAVRHDHVFHEAEHIVERRLCYTIVEKIGAAATEAARLDPRTPASLRV
jgi:formate-nitrite transporter family protein